MPSHELPDWEGPSPAPKRSVFHIPISISPIDKTKSFLGHKRDRSSFQAFDKETAVEATTPAITRGPSSRKYCGLGPRILLVIAVTLVLLLALIIGLAVGLTHKKSYVHLYLPLSISNSPNVISQFQSAGSPSPVEQRDLHWRPHLLQPRPRVRRLRVSEHVDGGYLRDITHRLGCGADGLEPER